MVLLLPLLMSPPNLYGPAAAPVDVAPKPLWSCCCPCWCRPQTFMVLLLPLLMSPPNLYDFAAAPVDVAPTTFMILLLPLLMSSPNLYGPAAAPVDVVPKPLWSCCCRCWCRLKPLWSCCCPCWCRPQTFMILLLPLLMSPPNLYGPAAAAVDVA